MQLINTFESTLGIYLDYWVEYRGIGSTIQVMVNPNIKPLFEDLLKRGEIKYTKTIEDVGVLFKNQILKNNINKADGDFDYGKYHTLDEINHWMNDLEAQYPKIITIFNVSRSYQSRDIYAMKISIPNASNKPAIWLDGGIHAREWFVNFSALTEICVTKIILFLY